MKWNVALFLLFLPGVCLAHPVDDPCPEGKKTTDGCQPVIKELGLANPEFFKAHKAYWHCRRELVVEDIVPYAKCIGKVQELQALLGLPVDEGANGLLEYWDVIPAHPELDEPGNPEVPRGQLEACEATRSIAGAIKYNCESTRQFLSWMVSNIVTKPAPICPVYKKKGNKCVPVVPK